MNIGDDPNKTLFDSIVGNDSRASVKGLDYNEFVLDELNGSDDEKSKKSEEEEVTESTDEDDSSSDEYDPTQLHIPTINEIVDNPKIAKVSIKDKTYTNHVALQNEVSDLVTILDQGGYSIPDKLRILAKRKNLDIDRLRKLKAALSDIYDTQSTAEYLTDWIIQGATMITTIFNGEFNIPIINIKPNLTGYSTRVKRESNALNKENTKLARKINKKIGKSTTSWFKWASIIVLPALVTIGQNHSSKKKVDYDKYDELDSDEEEEHSEEDEEEGEEEEESE